MGVNTAGSWFCLAFPDHDAARPVADRVMSCADVLAVHPSGRPWLLGCLPSTQLVVHNGGPNRLALVGSTTATSGQLSHVSDSARVVGDFARVSARFAGNYCVVGSLGGEVYAQGSAVGVRRVFHALVDGVRVVADRADILAELGGLPMDDTALALRLVRSLPHPFLETPLWRGLNVVAPENYVTVGRDGCSWTTSSWWRRPEPALSRAEGARRLCSALEAAVLARTGSGGLVSCDLSGGLDSTPLCYFAANGSADVIARTMYNQDPGGQQDLDWARSALSSMPGVREHLVESTDDMPDFFGGLLEMHTRIEEPTQAALAGPRMSHGLVDDAARGIGIHLNGMSGDHLLRGLRVWEHSLFRSRPLLAWRRARAMDAPDGYPIRRTLRDLLDGKSYREWLQEIVTDALDGVAPPEVPRLSDWSLPPMLPPRLSVDAREALAVELRDIARSADPLGRHRAAHAELFMLRDGARVARSASQFGPPAGVVYEAPLLDDHVAEAVLAVRREERDTPVEWKPLMKAAMKGLLPDEYLHRTTKVGGSAQAVRGLAAHQDDLHTLCETSGLSASGLVDMAKLTDATRPDPKAMPPTHVYEALNTAMFLRNQVHNRKLDKA